MEKRVAQTSRRARALVAFVAAITLAFTMCVMPAQAAETGSLAAGSGNLADQSAPSINARTLWLNSPYFEFVSVTDFPAGAEVTKATSGNPKVLEVKRMGTQPYQCQLIPKKVGKSKITLTYKVNGATKTVSGVYTVKKFPSPFSSITLNGKELEKPSPKNPKFECDSYYFTGTKATMKFAMAQGWEISNISGYMYTPGKGDGTSFTVENGKAFAVGKGKDVYISASVINSAGDFFNYSIRVQRGGELELASDSIWMGQKSSPHWASVSENASNNAVVTKVSSSDTSVLKVTKQGSKYYEITLVPKKVGKSKLSVTYKLDGKTHTTSAVYTVLAYPKPFKSIALNGKNIKISTHKFEYQDLDYKKTTAKVEFTMSSGWTLRSLMCYTARTSAPDDGTSKPINNGEKVKVPAKGYCSITAVATNESGTVLNYTVYLQRQ